MWFPPYDLAVSETNSVNWTDNVFLGRPEPIYTYNNTTRTGSLNWEYSSRPPFYIKRYC